MFKFILGKIKSYSKIKQVFVNNLLEKDKDYAKKIYWLGVISYLALAFLAILFYKERTIFLDSSFRFFYMIKNEGYELQANRFGSFFTQSFLYLSYAIGLPLKYIMINYSVGFIICNAFVFFVTLKWLKNPTLALTLLFVHVFMVAKTFYWIQSELIEGISFTILYFAMLQHFAKKGLNIIWGIVLLIMLITVVFFHPLLIIVFAFISLFFIISPENLNHRKYLLWNIPTAIGILVIKSTVFKAPYDSGVLSKTANIIKLFPDYWSMPSNAQFLRFMMEDYYFLPLLILVVLAFYLQQKSWLKLAFVFSFFFGYLFLINATFPHYKTRVHLESFHIPLSLFLLLPFVTDILPEITKKYALLLLSLVMLIRLVHIGLNHENFTANLDWKRGILKETAHLKNKKLLIQQKQVPMDLLVMSFGSPFEFWMLSTLEFGECRSIVIYNKRETVDKWGKSKKKNKFITHWGSIPYDQFKPPFFDFQDTSLYVDYKPLKQ